MNKIYNFKKQKGNLTINIKIDLRAKTIIKTVMILAIAIVVIIGLIKWLS